MTRKQQRTLFVLIASIFVIFFSLLFSGLGTPAPLLPTQAVLNIQQDNLLAERPEYHELESGQEFLIQLGAETSQSKFDQAVLELGIEVVEAIPVMDAYVARRPFPIDTRELQQIVPNVVIEPNYQIQSLLTIPTNDPLIDEQWALDALAINPYWEELPDNAEPVTVAVIDSGICLEHEDLQGRILDNGYDYVNNDNIPNDLFGHGCAVSGIIAANSDNGIGITGVAPNVNILPIRVLDEKGIGNYADLAAAIYYAVDNGADIINLSLGGQNYSQILEQAVNYALDRDVEIVAGTGNSGQLGVYYPARYEGVMAVGSLDANGKQSDFTSYGPELDTLAPGENILTTSIDGQYSYFTGTSMAVPHITGLMVVSDMSGLYLNLDHIVSTPAPDDGGLIYALATPTADNNVPAQPLPACAVTGIELINIGNTSITYQVEDVATTHDYLADMSHTYFSADVPVGTASIELGSVTFNDNMIWAGVGGKETIADGTWVSSPYLDNDLIKINYIANFSLPEYYEPSDFVTEFYVHNDLIDDYCTITPTIHESLIQPIPPTEEGFRCDDIQVSDISFDQSRIDIDFHQSAFDVEDFIKFAEFEIHYPAISGYPDMYLEEVWIDGYTIWSGDEAAGNPVTFGNLTGLPVNKEVLEYNDSKRITLSFANASIPLGDYMTVADLAGTKITFSNDLTVPQSNCVIDVVTTDILPQCGATHIKYAGMFGNTVQYRVDDVDVATDEITKILTTSTSVSGALHVNEITIGGHTLWSGPQKGPIDTATDGTFYPYQAIDGETITIHYGFGVLADYFYPYDFTTGVEYFNTETNTPCELQFLEFVDLWSFPPPDLTIQATDNNIQLDWTYDRPVEHFKLERQIPGFEWETVAIIDGDLRTFDDVVTQCDATYRWMMTAFDGVSYSMPSYAPEHTVSTCDVNTPTDLTAEAGELGIALNWNITGTYQGFKIERQKTVDSSPDFITTTWGSATTYTDYTYECGREYEYRIQSKGPANSVSSFSNIATVTFPCDPSLFIVNRSSDINDGVCDINSCSLREAIIAANAYGDGAVVYAPAGFYILSINGLNEDASLTGDLDITANIRVIGGGRDETTIFTNNSDRAFDIHVPTFTLEGTRLEDLQIWGGQPTAGDGAGIRNQGENTILTDVYITENTTTGRGGGIAVLSGKVSVIRSLIEDNIADIGGGIFNDAIVSVVHTTLDGNEATSTTLGGGGLFTYPEVTHKIRSSIKYSTISNNTAFNGGGIYWDVAGLLSVSTVSGNSALNHGGGIYNVDSDAFFGSGPKRIQYSTITNNRADSDSDNSGQGSGIYVPDETTIFIEDNIIYGNYNNDDCSTVPTALIRSFGGNFIGNTTNCYIEIPPDFQLVTPRIDFIGIDPLLSPLADNGGDTLTHALAYNSPARDRSKPDYLSQRSQVSDQRSILRDDPFTIDAGSYEFTSNINELPQLTAFDNYLYVEPRIFPRYVPWDGIPFINSKAWLRVHLSKVLYDPSGDTNIHDVTNPDNYVVVEAGADGTYNTTTCDAIVGDDVEIPFSNTKSNDPFNGYLTSDNLTDLGTPPELAYLPSEQVIIFGLPSFLQEGEFYRLIICNLQDIDGNLVDGNNDGVGGDPLIVDFHTDTTFTLFMEGRGPLGNGEINQDLSRFTSTLLDEAIDFLYFWTIPLYDPVGDTDANDVSNPNNYVVVDVGANGIPDTATCGAPQGDDIAIPFTYSETDYGDSSGYRYTFATPLLDGDYRFIICNLRYPDTNSYNFNSAPMTDDYVYDFKIFPRPTNALAASDISGVTLTWDDIATTEAGYAIERRANISGTGWAEIVLASANTTSYVDSSLTCGIDYQYRVQSRDATNMIRSGYTDTLVGNIPCAAGHYAVNTTSDVNDGVCDGVSCSLREAVIAANAYGDGAIVSVPAGTYTLSITGTGEDISATGDLDITANIHIIGAGQDQTIISANNIDRVFDIHTPTENTMQWVMIEALTVRDGQPENGADGGGILVRPDSNYAELHDVTVTQNESTGHGGGIAVFEHLFVTQSQITQNQALAGGGIHVGENSEDQSFIIFHIYESTVDSNTATSSTLGGGGLYMRNNGTTYLIESSTISNNIAEYGGGVYLEDLDIADLDLTIQTLPSDIQILDSTISGNDARVDGGGIYLGSRDDGLVSSITIRFSHITLTDNDADSDNNGSGLGGVYVGTNMVITSEASILYGNQPTDCWRASSESFPSVQSFIGDDGNCDIGSTGYHYVNYPNIDPQLGILQDNGGLTQTHNLASTSPAINKADLRGARYVHDVAKDQRGYQRDNIIVDHEPGAVEYGTTFNPYPQVVDVALISYLNQSIMTQVEIIKPLRSFSLYNHSRIGSYGPLDDLALYFDEPLYNPIGETHPNDPDNPDNYLIISNGANDTFETATCGLPQGDDVLVPFSTLDHDSNTVPAVRYFNIENSVSLNIGANALIADHYRIIVCNLQDVDGNPIDGNSDGTAGDPFFLDFSQDDFFNFLLTMNDRESNPPVQTGLYPLFKSTIDKPVIDFSAGGVSLYSYTDPSHPNSITNLDNLTLVDMGANGIADTTTCGLAQGDDTLIPIVVDIVGDEYKQYYYVPQDGQPLVDGNYRFLACNLVNPDDTPFDGDYDGYRGGDYHGDFMVFAHPTNIAATSGVGVINLTWDDVIETETSYIVERQVDGGDWSQVATLPANSTSYVDNAVTCGTDYAYRIQSYRDTDYTWSVFSDPVSLTFICNPGEYIVNTTSDINDGVCDTNSCSLREAVIAANAYGDGAVVNVPAGTYTLSIAGTGENASLTGDLDITANIRIIGAGRDQTIIDANDIDRVFDIYYPSMIESLAISDGTAPSGEDGGGIRINNGTYAGTIADPNPGITLKLFDLAIYDNTSLLDGGGIAGDNLQYITKLTLSDIYQNQAVNGGGISLYHPQFVTTQTHIHHNQASNNGGGVYFFEDTGDSNTLISDSTIANNSAINGAGLYSDSSSYFIYGSTISSNNADTDGGGIYNDNTYSSIVQATITENTADDNNSSLGNGGGIYTNNTLLISNSILSGNHDLGGEAVDCYTDSVSIESEYYNIIGDVDNCSIAYDDIYDEFSGSYPYRFDRDFIGYDPQLGILQDNGGNVPSHAIASDSIARERSFHYLYCNDIELRDGLHDLWINCDIGAYQFSQDNSDPALLFKGVEFFNNIDRYSYISSNENTYSTIFDYDDVVYDGGAIGDWFLRSPNYILGDGLALQFNQSLYDPYGDHLPNDASNLSNYLVVTAGANGTFDTSTCVISGDDVLIELDEIVIDNLSGNAYIRFADTVTLSIDTYRLNICNLESALGIPLDGNRDGVTGDSVLHEFSTTSGATVFAIFDTNMAPESTSPYISVTIAADMISRMVFDYPLEFFRGLYFTPMNESTIEDPQNYLLVEYGSDGIFQTESCTRQGDDVSIPIADITYRDANTDSLINLQSPITNGVYRFIACDGIQSQSGYAIDGNFDNVEGGHSIGEFMLFPKPRNVQVMPSASGISVTWEDINTSETGIALQRQTGSGDWEEIALLSPNTTSYIDTTATCGLDYSYRVQSRRSTDEVWSNFTKPVTVTNTCSSGTYLVNTTSDVNDSVCDVSSCSLREAVIAANAYGDGAIVAVPAGTYTLSIAGTDEDASLTGDLDITANIHIVGAGQEQTIISANNIDRVFDIHTPTENTMQWVMIEGLTVRDGQPENGADGGGILVRPDSNYAELHDVLVTQNETTGHGGGIAVFKTLLVSDSVISQNQALVGGGIHVGEDTVLGHLEYAYLHLDGSTVDGNIATSSTVGGGGLHLINNGTIHAIMGTTISNNIAENGGGVYVANLNNDHINGNLRMLDSTISDNDARVDGGGIYVDSRDDIHFDPISLTSSHITLTDNKADSDNNGSGLGGGVYLGTNTLLSAESSILYDNQPTDCWTISTRSTTATQSFVGDDGNCDAQSQYDNLLSYHNIDPQLSILQDNGGLTETHDLASTSPALDKADLRASYFAHNLVTDQRGYTRDNLIVGHDSGAVEYGATLNPYPQVINVVRSGYSNQNIFTQLEIRDPSPNALMIFKHLPEDSWNQGRNILIYFDEALYNPVGDTHPNDPDNPDNYLIVSNGADNTFQTETCGLPQGDDVLVPLGTLDSQSNTVPMVHYFNIGNVVSLNLEDVNLAKDHYRIIACNLQDVDGNALDGNSDSIAGDPFLFDFSHDDYYLFLLSANFSPESSNFRLEFLPTHQVPVLEPVTELFAYGAPHYSYTDPVHPNSITNLDNLTLVDMGTNGIADTTTCGLAQGDDTFIPIVVNTFNNDGTILYFYVPQDGQPLVDGNYRFLACNLLNPDDTPFDGDLDGYRGGDFFGDFTVFAHPTNITATSGEAVVNLTWDDVITTETSYIVERQVAGGEWSQVTTLPANSTSYDDSAVTCGVDYAYRIQSYRDTDHTWSLFSDPASLTFTCDLGEYIVNSTSDVNDGVCDVNSCSLREAVIAANAYGDGAVVNVPAGTYTLSIAGTGEDATATGDLDITANIRIIGAGRDQTVISANNIDRVFDIFSPTRIEYLTVRDGQPENAAHGGGIRVNEDNVVPFGEPVYLNGLIVKNNMTLNGTGGGISSVTPVNGYGFETYIIYSIVENNQALSGGGISALQRNWVNIRETEIRDNIATQLGGGIYADTHSVAVVVDLSTVANNMAQFGGGIYLDNESQLITYTSTYSGNQATEDGGGIYFDDQTSIFSWAITVTQNVADSDSSGSGYGGGIVFNTSEDLVTNFGRSIIAGNIDNTGVSPDCHISNGYRIDSSHRNIIGDTLGCDILIFETTIYNEYDILNTDPLLLPLADNGGYTRTHAIPANSPAIGLGAMQSCAGAFLYDQRGVRRDIESGCDAGAFEYENGVSVVNPEVISVEHIKSSIGPVTVDDFYSQSGSSIYKNYFDVSADVSVFSLKMNQSVKDPVGDDGANDVSNLANYLVLTAGANQTFETATCGVSVGDDTLISIDSLFYAQHTNTLYLNINGNIGLPIGTYRIIACNLVNQAGQAMASPFVYDLRIGDTLTASGVVIGDVDTQKVSLPAVQEYDEPQSEINVIFNRDVSNPSGNSSVIDPENPNNYHIVEAGADGIFQTNSCTMQGDDTQTAIASINYNITVDYKYYASLTPANALGDGHYRLIVCDNLQAMGTNRQLDGDANGIDGGHYISEFNILLRPTSVNSVKNGWITISWNDLATTETEYRIERSRVAQPQSWKLVGTAPADATEFIDKTLTCDSEDYQYRIQVYRATDNVYSGYSPQTTPLSYDCPALTPPTNLSGTVVDGLTIDLTWDDNIAYEREVVVERSLNNTDWDVLATLEPDTEAYSDTGLICYQTYYYRVASQSPLHTEYSNIWTDTSGCTPLNPLTSISASIISETTAQVTWSDDNLDESGFRILRRITDTWSEVGTVIADVTSFDDTTLDCTVDVTYDYQIEVYRNADGDTNISPITTVQTTDCAFNAPTALTTVSATANGWNLTWTDNSVLESSYHLQRSIDNVNWINVATSLPVNTTSYIDNTIECETAYYYQLKSYQASFDRYTDVVSHMAISPQCSPELPQGIVSNLANNQMAISWQPVSQKRTTQLIIERAQQPAEAIVGLSGELDWQLLTTVPSNLSVFTDFDLQCATNYWYRITGYNAQNNEYTVASESIAISTADCPVPVTNTVGLYRNGQWLFRDGLDNSAPIIEFRFGPQEEGWTPLTGDWDGDGVDGIGIYKNGIFALRDISSSGVVDYVYRFGSNNGEWQPLVGDWNGDGTDTVGIYRKGTVLLTDSHQPSGSDYEFNFGFNETGWVAITGDWYKTGRDLVGIYKEGTFLLQKTVLSRSVGASFNFGLNNDTWQAITGDWDGDGYTTIGLFTGREWLLRNTNSRGTPDITFSFGNQNNVWIPIASYRGSEEAIEGLALNSVIPINVNLDNQTAPEKVVIIEPVVIEDTATEEPTLSPTPITTVSGTDDSVEPTITATTDTSPEVTDEPQVEVTVTDLPTVTPLPTSTPLPSPTATETPIPTTVPSATPVEVEPEAESTEDPESSG